MSTFTAIDLSQLAAPDVVEQIDYEIILRDALEDFHAKMRELDIDYLILESDPAYKLAEVFAYREMLVRQRANESARSVLLAYAEGSDLDHKAAERNLKRREISPATATTAAVYETNASLRNRVQLAPESYTTAGPEGSYLFHALNADVRVKDVQPHSPTPGIVNIYVLSNENDGKAGDDLLDVVDKALNKKEIRPLTDNVNIYSASITNYRIDAVLEVESGPDSDVILKDALNELSTYTTQMHALNKPISLSGIYRALHRPGVENVVLNEPTKNLDVSIGQAAYCTEHKVMTSIIGVLE